MKKTTKSLVAIAIASTMCSMLTLPVSATTPASTTTVGTTKTTSTAKVTTNSIDLTQPEFGGQVKMTYKVTGNLALAKDGAIKIAPTLAASLPDDTKIDSVEITIKGSSTATKTFVSDEDDDNNYDERVEDLYTDGFTFKLSDFESATMTTLAKKYSNLTAATTATKTGMPWVAGSNFTPDNALHLDSIDVTIIVKMIDPDAYKAITDKQFKEFTKCFENTTATFTGDLQAYTTGKGSTSTDTLLYVAGEYDSTQAPSDSVAALKSDLATIDIWAKYQAWVTSMGTNPHAISDYINIYYMAQAHNYRNILAIAGGTDKTTLSDWSIGGVVPGTPSTATGPVVDITLPTNRTTYNAGIPTCITKQSGETQSALDYVISQEAFKAVVADTEKIYVESTSFSDYISTASSLESNLKRIETALNDLNKYANKSVTDSKLKEVAISGITKTKTTENIPLRVYDNTWVNIGNYFDIRNNCYFLAEINDIIGTNRGCTVVFHVIPDSVGKNDDSTDNRRGSGMYFSRGTSCAVRVNGYASSQYGNTLTFNAQTSTIEFDWDEITKSKLDDASITIRSLELLSSQSMDIDSVTITVPDQTAYVAEKAAEDAKKTTNSSADSIEEIKSGELQEADGVDLVEDIETPPEDLDLVTAAPADDYAYETETTTPQTGNKEIALAVIPLALAAVAAIIKDKK